MTDAPLPAPYPVQIEARPRWSGLAIAAVVVAILITVVLLTLRTVAAAWSFDEAPDGHDAGALAFGGLLLSGIAFDLLCIVLAHIALFQTRGGARRGAVLAAVALGAGYIHVLLWGNRLVNATIATVGSDPMSGFVANNFWWA